MSPAIIHTRSGVIESNPRTKKKVNPVLVINFEVADQPFYDNVPPARVLYMLYYVIADFVEKGR